MSDVVYIGRVKWVHENYDKGYRFATVEPLIQSSADQKRWIGSIKDPLDEFPGRGFVNWHDAPKGLEVGDYRQFDIQPHPYYKGQTDKEAFQIRNHKYPTEVVDLRDCGSERDIRILLTSKGVFLNEQPIVERCVLWVQDEKWVGPLDLARRAGTSSWVLAPSQRLDSIRCWKIPPASIQEVELDGTRYLLTPSQDSLGQHLGFATWEADEILAKRVLNRLLKRDRKTAEALKVTKDIFKTYIDVVEKAGLVGSELEQELSFRDRIQEILDVIAKNEELLDEAASVCFSIGPIKNEIATKAEKEYKRRLSEHQAQLDLDLLAKKKEIEEAEADLEEKRSDLASLQKQITAAKQMLKNQVDLFDAEMTEKLREVAKKPERMLAEMELFRFMSSAIRTSHSPLTQGVLSQKPVSVSNAPVIGDPNAFVGALSQRLLGLGVSTLVGQALHCALSSGAVPVLTGTDAHEVARSYAECVSGGVLHWIPVGGGLYEPADLLGNYNPTSGSFVPHPGRLLDLLLDNADAVHLVVLDGFNRAAVDGYLLPLLQSLRDATEGRDQFTIPLVAPGTVADRDPYGTVQRVAWNPNVLLLLRPAAGTCALPVPREFWAHSVIIDTEDPVGVGELPPQEITRVSKADWITWSDRSRSLSGPIEELSRHPESRTPLPRTIRRKIERLYGSGVVIGLKPERAMEQALKIGLVPYLVTCEEPLGEWLQTLGIELDDMDRRVENIVRQLGE